MPGVTPRLTRHYARNAPGILGVKQFAPGIQRPRRTGGVPCLRSGVCGPEEEKKKWQVELQTSEQQAAERSGRGPPPQTSSFGN